MVPVVVLNIQEAGRCELCIVEDSSNGFESGKLTDANAKKKSEIFESRTLPMIDRNRPYNQA